MSLIDRWLPRSLHSTAGAPQTARKKMPAAPVGMTENRENQEKPKTQAGVPVPLEVCFFIVMWHNAAN